MGLPYLGRCLAQRCDTHLTPATATTGIARTMRCPQCRKDRTHKIPVFFLSLFCNHWTERSRDNHVKTEIDIKPETILETTPDIKTEKDIETTPDLEIRQDKTAPEQNSARCWQNNLKMLRHTSPRKSTWTSKVQFSSNYRRFVHRGTNQAAVPDIASSLYRDVEISEGPMTISSSSGGTDSGTITPTIRTVGTKSKSPSYVESVASGSSEADSPLLRSQSSSATSPNCPTKNTTTLHESCQQSSSEADSLSSESSDDGYLFGVGDEEREEFRKYYAAQRARVRSWLTTLPPSSELLSTTSSESYDSATPSSTYSSTYSSSSSSSSSRTCSYLAEETSEDEDKSDRARSRVPEGLGLEFSAPHIPLRSTPAPPTPYKIPSSPYGFAIPPHVPEAPPCVPQTTLYDLPNPHTFSHPTPPLFNSPAPVPFGLMTPAPYGLITPTHTPCSTPIIQSDLAALGGFFSANGALVPTFYAAVPAAYALVPVPAYGYNVVPVFTPPSTPQAQYNPVPVAPAFTPPPTPETNRNQEQKSGNAGGNVRPNDVEERRAGSAKYGRAKEEEKNHEDARRRRRMRALALARQSHGHSSKYQREMREKYWKMEKLAKEDIRNTEETMG